MAQRSERSQTIGLIGGPSAFRDGQDLYIHVSFGRVIEEFSSRFRRVCLCVGEVPAKGPMQDYRLPGNVELIPMPHFPTALHGLSQRRAVKKAYAEIFRLSDFVLVRGILTPAVLALYRSAARSDTPVVHWLVGNPMALLRSHRRSGIVRDAMGRLAVFAWERALHRGHRRARAAYLSNGAEIAARHPSENSHVTVSTTLREEDFFRREDTCQHDPVRILTLAFVRPEKGFEYLLEAFSFLKTKRPTRLILAGGRERYPGYQRRLDDLVQSLGIGSRVEWVGHVDHADVPALLRTADVFAFPSLSEGTPRVLLEARAASLPVISTDVGGIPDSVTHEHDGLLVPPKDPVALSSAIDRVIEDGDLRRSLVENGLRTAAERTVHTFVDQVVKIASTL